MNKADKIFYLLQKIEKDSDTINNRFNSLLKSIENYIHAVPYLNSLAVTALDGSMRRIAFRSLGVEIDISSTVKIFTFESTQDYCDEITFSLVNAHGEENETVLKLYITFDGFIVTDPTQPGSICQTSNDYKGKLVLEQLFVALLDKRIISL